MSRKVALLQILGKEQEYFQPTDEIANPELVAVPPLEDPKESTADSVSRPLHDQPLFDQPLFDRQSLRFRIEVWPLPNAAPEAARTLRRFRLRSGGWGFFGIQR